MKHHPFLEMKRKQVPGKICQKNIFLAKFWIDKKNLFKGQYFNEKEKYLLPLVGSLFGGRSWTLVLNVLHIGLTN